MCIIYSLSCQSTLKSPPDLALDYYPVYGRHLPGKRVSRSCIFISFLPFPQKKEKGEEEEEEENSRRDESCDDFWPLDSFILSGWINASLAEITALIHKERWENFWRKRLWYWNCKKVVISFQKRLLFQIKGEEKNRVRPRGKWVVCVKVNAFITAPTVERRIGAAFRRCGA